MRQHHAILALGLTLLAGCANEVAPPPATATSRPASTAASGPAPRVTTFDGLWVGTMTLNPDRTRACPPASQAERELTVRQGRASLVINPATRQTLAGLVASEGSVRMVDSLDRTIATTGLFTEALFLGEYRNGLCSYAIRMTKRG